MTPVFPTHIDVYVNRQGEFRFTIDGVDFPWEAESLTVGAVEFDGIPSLRITIPAHRITFEQTISKDNA